MAANVSGSGIVEPESPAGYDLATVTSFPVWHGADDADTPNGTAYPYDADAAKPWPALRQPFYGVVLLSIAYMLVALVGVISNTLVISVVYSRANMKTVTNYFLVNLATADILVCLCVLPVTLLQNIYTGWRMTSC